MYQKVFKAGKYGDFEVTADMLHQIAGNYDTSYKKSPVNIDHWGSESYGWIESVVVNGEYLEAEISFTDEGKALLATGKYKYPSVEFVDYDGMPYLRAIALTNYNRVKNLPELKYSEENIRRFAETSCKFNFAEVFKETSNQNSNIKMKNLITKLADLLSVSYTESSSDETILQSVIAAAETAVLKVKSFDDAGVTVELYNELKDQTKSFDEKRANGLVDSAVAANKIDPAQKEKYLKLAVADYQSVADIFAEIKPGTLFNKNTVAGKSAYSNPNSSSDESEDYSEVKYEDLLRNPEKYIDKLSDEQFEKIKSRVN